MRHRLALAAIALAVIGCVFPGVASARFNTRDFQFRTIDPASSSVAGSDLVDFPGALPLLAVKGRGTTDWLAQDGFASGANCGSVTVPPCLQQPDRLTNTTNDDAFMTMPSMNRAGAHPALNIWVRWDSKFDLPPWEVGPNPNCPTGSTSPGNPAFNPDCTTGADEDPRQFTITLPPGMIGNPQLVPRCPYPDFLRISRTHPHLCPSTTQIGYLQAQSAAAGRPPLGTIYNLSPVGSEVARLGAVTNTEAANATFDKIIVPIRVKVRTAGNFAIDTTQDLPAVPPIAPVESGNPSGLPADLDAIGISIFAKVNGAPFLTNPTSCAPLEAEVSATGDEGTFSSRSYPFVPDCSGGMVPFAPTMSISADNDRAGAPSGYEVGIQFPNYDAGAAVYESQIERTSVELPDGVRLNPAAARELDGCSDAQFGVGSNDPIACPSGADIGDVSVDTPTVDADPSTPARDPLHGNVYFARPTAGHQWRIFMSIEDAGLRIKLPGEVQVDDATGQVTTVFEDLPPLPFTDFKLRLRGGDHAVLLNPESCGTHTGDALLHPHSAASGTPDVQQQLGVVINSDCPATNPGFAPTVEATPSTKQAGAPVSQRLVIRRPDADKLLKGMNLSLPPGLIGSLSHVATCAATDAATGNCPLDSRVGSITGFVGSSDATEVGFPGSIYVSEPLRAGDPASLAIVIPAKTGPIDLGNVVVHSRLVLRQSDSGIDAVTDDIPRIFKGIALKVRRIQIDVNRDDFLINQTSCAPRTFIGTFTDVDDGSASATIDAQAEGCDRLAFSPRLRFVVPRGSQIAQRGKPRLRAIVTQPAGQSAIARAQVLLPDVLRPDTVQLNKPGVLCNGATLAANACGPQSIVGHATAVTPLLPQPLTGPIYIIQAPGNILPTLVVRLQGMVSIDLRAGNRIVGVRTENLFDSVPDVPVSRFELGLDGGKNGILQNFNDLCDKPSRADATFTGHSGAVANSNPKLEVEGCGAAVLAFTSKKAKVAKRGTVKLPIMCKSLERGCHGSMRITDDRGRKSYGSARFDLQPGQSSAVRVKLSKAARRKLARGRHRLKARVTTTLDGKKQSQRLTLVAR